MKKLVSDCPSCLHCGSAEDPRKGSVVIKLSEIGHVNIETEGLTVEEIRYALGIAVNQVIDLKK